VKSGELDPASPVRQSSIPRSGSFTEARRIYSKGSTGLGMALLADLWWLGARAAAGTLSAGQAPAISCSSEVESARGSTAEASAGFIGAGAGRRHRHGLARCGAHGVGRWACSVAFRARRTRGGVLLPMFNSSPRSQTCESWQKSGAGLLLAPRAVSCM
jgi:hypothetical protein